ncbi:hypothetical protein [uncultured Corynebacterium sp.]|uniref:hypothetical protein n=1 Tax=uncultured Corynebacterium sp. TaxID=159447 RepID=UPI0025E765A7|nr:hypothetical protein [uncultured Corynebacterium sp.]
MLHPIFAFVNLLSGKREYHEKKGLQIAASLLIFSLPTSMATAGEEEDKNVETVMSETALKQEADYTAVSPAFGPEEGVQVRSAEGITSAPGGQWCARWDQC